MFRSVNVDHPGIEYSKGWVRRASVGQSTSSRCGPLLRSVKPGYGIATPRSLRVHPRPLLSTLVPLSLYELLALQQDRGRVKALVRDLLAETATTFFGGAPNKHVNGLSGYKPSQGQRKIKGVDLHVAVSGVEITLEEPGAHLRTIS